MLTEARTRLNVSQAELAKLACISVPSVKAYERGARHPSRPYLVAMLDALKLPVMERNAIMEACNYAPDGKEIVPTLMEMRFSAEGAQAEVSRSTWPSFVLNEALELVFYNEWVERLWDVDIAREYPAVSDRSLLAVASQPRYADRVLNWDDAVGTIASVFKGHFRGNEDIEQPSPIFGQMLEKLMEGSPAYVTRFARLFAEVPAAPLLLRWHYPMRWDVPGVGVIEFDCVVSNCNQAEGWAFNDWIPTDSESWRVLEAVKSGAARAAST